MSFSWRPFIRKAWPSIVRPQSTPCLAPFSHRWLTGSSRNAQSNREDGGDEFVPAKPTPKREKLRRAPFILLPLEEYTLLKREIRGLTRSNAASIRSTIEKAQRLAPNEAQEIETLEQLAHELRGISRDCALIFHYQKKRNPLASELNLLSEDDDNRRLRRNERQALYRVQNKALKRFVCQICESAFGSPQILEAHLASRAHIDKVAGVQSLKSKSAKRQEDLRRRNIELRRYTCAFCGPSDGSAWVFCTGAQLQRHLKTKRHAQRVAEFNDPTASRIRPLVRKQSALGIHYPRRLRSPNVTQEAQNTTQESEEKPK